MAVVRKFRSLSVNLELPPSARPAGFLKLSERNFDDYEFAGGLNSFFKSRLDEIVCLSKIGKVKNNATLLNINILKELIKYDESYDDTDQKTLGIIIINKKRFLN